MRRLWGLFLVLPGLCWAGAYDYYECVGPDGSATYSVERCAKGEKQRRVEDDAAPVNRSLGAAAGGIVRLASGPGGHFFATIAINGVPARVMVDTGATTVAISPSAAHRIGLDLQRGRRVRNQTANGVAEATAVVLNSVELGGNVVRNVVGVVMSQDMGKDFDVLLGMNFLKHFEVNSDGYVMTLRPK
ncbi:MAG: retropepsin-like aspartic protease [Rhodocyclaceae bacterium]|nr:retropepsin-like aspartic protease [Rhodocyclaceae bacterium]